MEDLSQTIQPKCFSSIQNHVTGNTSHWFLDSGSKPMALPESCGKPLPASIMGPTCPFLKARNLKLHSPHKRRHVQIPLGVSRGLREQGPCRLRSPFFDGVRSMDSVARSGCIIPRQWCVHRFLFHFRKLGTGSRGSRLWFRVHIGIIEGRRRHGPRSCRPERLRLLVLAQESGGRGRRGRFEFNDRRR